MLTSNNGPREPERVVQRRERCTMCRIRELRNEKGCSHHRLDSCSPLSICFTTWIATLTMVVPNPIRNRAATNVDKFLVSVYMQPSEKTQADSGRGHTWTMAPARVMIAPASMPTRRPNRSAMNGAGKVAAKALRSTPSVKLARAHAGIRTYPIDWMALKRPSCFDVG